MMSWAYYMRHFQQDGQVFKLATKINSAVGSVHS